MEKFKCDGCKRERSRKEGGTLAFRRVECQNGTWARYAHSYRFCDTCINVIFEGYETIKKEGTH